MPCWKAETRTIAFASLGTVMSGDALDRPMIRGYSSPTIMAAYGGAPSEPTVVTVGDMAVTPTTVVTPAGRYPLAGTTWVVSNNTMMTESIPAYAIVLAIIFFVFCLLGLLFLLIKERKVSGFMQVSVQGP